MHITTILFDFVGVLMKLNPSTGVSPQVEWIDRHIGKVVDDHQFRESVLKQYSFSDQQFEALLDQVVDRYEPFDSLWQMLPALRQRYHLGVINNGTWLTFPRFNAKYGIDRQFDIFISSALAGVRKPDPQIYLLACEKLHVLPGQCLFMDDNQDNVSAAIQLGMQGIWWETHEIGIQSFQTWVNANNCVRS